MNKNFKHNNTTAKSRKNIGEIDIINPIAQLVLDDNASVEIIAKGFQYTDSPVWVDTENLLLFTDLPNKRIHYWKEHYKETKTYLEAIDFIGQNTKQGELSSSALLFNKTGDLTLFLYGKQKIAKMNAAIREPKFNFTTWINNPKKHVLVTPSIFTEDNTDNIYFTDTISEQEPSKSSLYGLFRIDAKNKLELLLSNPIPITGITFSSDNKHVFLTCSDKKKAYLHKYNIVKKNISDSINTFDYTPFISDSEDFPKGLKTDKFGNIYTTGPNGIWIFNKELELIARIYFTELASNCVFNHDFKTLYITANDKLLKLKLRN
ncbi:SMP-30/gluconolactonase/LRE family protein [Myroides sp. M-43]|uniref:SMP-30/gluconolactonase/LRE family protein n=1 Tax=Myroides oncorhynchi TaxID=2893756 RepID=UPI001E528143|nr:SMP-30/gluconolactonase/LRE family protein [Myroides oncorhynchi]MCC9041257.1 SMP-30/gluconolactonase/LRE family protein [Myroides oncorhynchi]